MKMETTIIIDGMSCQYCVMAVKKEIQKLDVQKLNVQIGKATVEFDEIKLKIEAIENAIKEAGYIVIH
jgi:copper chaperone CopZ